METNSELVPLLVVQGAVGALFSRFSAAPPPKDPASLRDAPGPRQEPARAPRIHLLLGPVGAGKSTFGLVLAGDLGAVRLTLDDWMTQLFRPDRPDDGVIEWYIERAARCVERIAAVAIEIVRSGCSVVLEIGLLRRSEREKFYRRLRDADVALTIHVLDAAREVRRERVEQRNRVQGPTFAMVVPPAIFELASDRWEPLDLAECQGRDVRMLRTDTALPLLGLDPDRIGEGEG